MKLLGTFLLIGLLGGTGARAQDTVPCTPGVLNGGSSLGMMPRRSYTATIKTSFEQRLIDGNVIKGEIRTHAAMNSKGWSRMENSSGCFRDAEGKSHLAIFVIVYKNKPRETITWMEGDSFGRDKVATLSRPVEVSAEERAAQLEKARAEAATRPPAPNPARQEARTESLGIETIAGSVANGTRTTRTILPGEEGNLLPLIVTFDTWSSKDGMTVRTVSDDPRRGRTTTEMEEIRFGEPDASLFAPPEGYTVKESVPQVMVPVKMQ